MNSTQEKYILIALWLLTGIYVGLTIIGGITHYTPVPYADMWNSINFASQASTGNISVWWAQHNEHRILLSRILFWIDLSWFRGQSWFLIICNYLLLTTSCITYYLLLKERLTPNTTPFVRKIMGMVVIMIVFSWIQNENLTWTFQSQFFLAQLLPLLAFFLLHKAYISTEHSRNFFIAASFTGIAALGSMANGVLALPLMAFLALALRFSWQRIISLVLLATLGIAVYFYHYRKSVSPGFSHTDLSTIIQYILLYLGGPLQYVLHKQLLTQAAGFFLLAATAFFIWKSIKAESTDSLQLTLLTFLLYIEATALLTSAGRFTFGINQAFSSRYQTPVLMAWAALFLLYIPYFTRLINKHPRRGILLVLLPALMLLPPQFRALRIPQDIIFNQFIAALALELGVNDQAKISLVSSLTPNVLSIAVEPVKQKLSVFGEPLISNAVQLIGKTDGNYTSVKCLGGLDSIEEIKNEPRYDRITGWLFESNKQISPKIIYILDKNRRIVGYALTGRPQAKKAVNSSFKGYLLKQSTPPFIIKGVQPDCELKAISSYHNIPED